jgi:hypothetical protein
MYVLVHEREVKGKQHLLTHMANSHMLASISLQREKEAENRSRNRPKFDRKVLGYVAWKKDWVHHHEEVYPSLLWST